MKSFIEIILVLLILSTFSLLNSSRLGASIRLVAWQGILAGLLPVAISGHDVSLRIIATGAVMIIMKGMIFPRLLLRALRASETRREQQPLLGNMASLIFGVFALLGAFWLDARISLAGQALSSLAFPTAIVMMLTGLFLIVTRRIALNQVIGFLVLENGIYVLGLVAVGDVPTLIELGVLMDVFVAVFVMGIAICHINREFDHMDSDRLTSLKG
ncbi:MAG: hydrogenase [Kiritimatiellia bacterium]|jgi:hydrogenase-4 component E